MSEATESLTWNGILLCWFLENQIHVGVAARVCGHVTLSIYTSTGVKFREDNEPKSSAEYTVLTFPLAGIVIRFPGSKR